MNTTDSEKTLGILSKLDKLTYTTESIINAAQNLQRELVDIQAQIYQLKEQAPEKDNMRRLMHCSRQFLNSKISAKTAEDLKEIHGIVLGSDATNRDAMNAVVLKKAREGDPEYIKAAEEFGLMPDGDPRE